jgi:hypothetical protein
VFNMRSDGGTSNAQQVSEHLYSTGILYVPVFAKMGAVSDIFFRVSSWIMALAVS